MKTYEYYADVLPDGHLSVPENIKDKLKTDAKVKVVLLIEDENTTWNNFIMSQFLKGYSDKDAIYDGI